MLYRSSGKHFLGWESGVSLSLSVIITGLILFYYGYNSGLELSVIATTISFTGTLSTLFFMPFFIHSLLGKTMHKSLRLFFIINTVVYSSALLFIPQTHHFEIIGPFAGKVSNPVTLSIFIVYGILFYGTLCYCFILGFIKRTTIADKNLHRIYKVSFSIALVYLPILILFTAFGKQEASIICLTLMFLSLSIPNLYYSVFFSKQPAYICNNSLSDYFINTFQISNREKEVIVLLLSGKANKDIANDLTISVRTIENHLSNIYQKTNVSGRVQLINLIRSNAG